MRYARIDGDRHRELLLPSGRLAADARLSEIRDELRRLKIVVDATSGKDALLNSYSDAIHKAAESLRPNSVKRGSPLGQLEIKKAVAHMAQEAGTR